jgi:kynurenine formamidase
MRFVHFILAAALVWLTTSMAHAIQSDRLVDLTHPFDAQTIYWPTEEGFKLISEAGGVSEQGYYYAANRFVCAEHGGTHIDAPRHFAEQGQTVDQLPLERLVGPAVRINVEKE